MGSPPVSPETFLTINVINFISLQHLIMTGVLLRYSALAKNTSCGIEGWLAGKTVAR